MDAADPSGEFVRLDGGGVTVLFSPEDAALAYWGARLPQGDPHDETRQWRLLRERATVTNLPDEPASLSVVPTAATAWPGTPAFGFSRLQVAGGRPRVTAPSPLWILTACRQEGPERLVAEYDDHESGIALELTVVLEDGLLGLRAQVTNTDPGSALLVHQALLMLPVPAECAHLLDFTGRHLRENHPQVHAFTQGTHRRDNRRGRTGHDSTGWLFATSDPAPRFTAGSGYWGVHAAWSGNHTTLAERLPTGERYLAAGHLLSPGEVVLDPGQCYTTPWVRGIHGRTLNQVMDTTHRWVRSHRPHNGDTTRPVTLNVWEAVYFDHDEARLLELAERAAAVGVERFVLDDGWFLGRRDDSSSLGDWNVDPQVWPRGLDPLVRRVRELGMEFGLWFEPEMVSLDSELAREHPKWVLRQRADRHPPQFRHQQALNLADPGAWNLVLARMSALIDRHRIDYVKWDHNRDVLEAGAPVAGTAGFAPSALEQTRAFYGLVDELRRRHPWLRVESCASGGGRIDLEVLTRVDRVWPSDCIDPVERQRIERWTSLLVPPEMAGSHVGAPVAHTTGRHSSLAFRAATALFSHFGVEWNLLECSPSELEDLAGWIRYHQQWRPVLHAGRTLYADTEDWLNVRACLLDAADAGPVGLVSMAALDTAEQWPPGNVRVPGLRSDRRHHVRVSPMTPLSLRSETELSWTAEGAAFSGAALAAVGLPVPPLNPGSVALWEFHRISAGAAPDSSEEPVDR